MPTVCFMNVISPSSQGSLFFINYCMHICISLYIPQDKRLSLSNVTLDSKVGKQSAALHIYDTNEPHQQVSDNQQLSNWT